MKLRGPFLSVNPAVPGARLRGQLPIDNLPRGVLLYFDSDGDWALFKCMLDGKVLGECGRSD